MNLFQGWSADAQWWFWTGVKMLGIIGFMLGTLPIVIWGERKVAAHIQFVGSPGTELEFAL